MQSKAYHNRAHPTSYPTGGLQALLLTIPYATAYCPPMNDSVLHQYKPLQKKRQCPAVYDLRALFAVGCWTCRPTAEIPAKNVHILSIDGT